MGKCRDLNGSVVKTVVLGISLGESTLENREQLAAEALKNAKVQKAILAALRNEAETLISANLSGKPLNGAAARSFLGPIAKAAQPALIEQIKKQKEYAEASAGLKKLKCAFDEAPIGAFIDDNKTLLVIVGVLVGASGAVVLYHFRAGDIPAKGLSALTNLAAKKIAIGDVSFGVKGLDFEPSKRNISGAATFSAGKAKSIKTTFTVKTAIKAGNLNALSVSDNVVVSLSDSTKLSAKAALGLEDSKPTYDMVLKISYKHDAFKLDLSAYTRGIGIEQTIGTRAKAGVDFDSSRVLGWGSRTSVEATATMATTPSGSGSGSIQIGLSGTF